MACVDSSSPPATASSFCGGSDDTLSHKVVSQNVGKAAHRRRSNEGKKS